MADHPRSPLADDALAELVYVKAYSLARPDEANNYLDLLKERFPATNALDNAYNWVAPGYREIYTDWWQRPEIIDPCAEARDAYEVILKEFAHTRFAEVAADELDRLR